MTTFSTPTLSFFVLLGLILASSCATPYFYAPTASQAIGLEEKGDVKLSIGGARIAKNIGFNNYFIKARRFYNGQVAFSPLKHLGLQASYNQYTDTPNTADGDFQNTRIREFAAGHYTTLKKKGNAEKKAGFQIGLENYLGYGDGKITFQRTGFESVTTFQKYFLQSSINLRLKKRVLFGISIRPTHIRFNQGQLTVPTLPPFTDNFARLENQSNFTVVDMGLRVQYGFRHSKIFLSSNHIIRPRGSRDVFLSHSHFIRANFNFGLIVELDEFFRKAN